MRMNEIFDEDFALPLGSVPKVKCACATKQRQSKNRKPKLAVIRPKKPSKPRPTVKPVR